VHVLELETGAVRDLGLMASAFRLEQERVLVLTPEEWQGADLDGDQQLSRTILQVHDLRSGRTLNTGLEVQQFDEFRPMVLDGELLVLEIGGRLKAVLLR
jgi:hypothetical protein